MVDDTYSLGSIYPHKRVIGRRPVKVCARCPAKIASNRKYCFACAADLMDAQSNKNSSRNKLRKKETNK